MVTLMNGNSYNWKLCLDTVLFYNNFSPTSEQPEQCVLPHTWCRPTCIAIFHKSCCFTKHEGIITNFTLGGILLLVVYYWYVKIPQRRYMEHGLKDVAFYVQKHIALWAIVFATCCLGCLLWAPPTFVRLVYWNGAQLFNSLRLCDTYMHQ